MVGPVGLYKRDPFSLDGMGNDGLRASLHGTHGVESPQDGRHIVSVNLFHVPLEGTEFCRERPVVDHAWKQVRLLGTVVVHDQGEVVGIEMGCRHDCFPDLTFLHLAVTAHHIGAVSVAIEASGEGMTQSD